jgi:hypothetical protein
MDPTVFETWLGKIVALTEPQRRWAWQALALSETADSNDIENPALVPQPNPAGAASVGELGQRRVDIIDTGGEFRRRRGATLIRAAIFACNNDS